MPGYPVTNHPNPKRKKSEFQKKTQAKVAAKVKETALQKIQVGISAKLVILILEVTCRVLEQIQDKLSSSVAKQLVNTIGAISLSYRFEQSKKLDAKKAEFFRQTAVDQLTALLDGAGNQLGVVQEEMRSKLATAADVRSFVSDKLHDMFQFAEAQTVGKVESKVKPMAQDARAVLQAAGVQEPPSVVETAVTKKEEIVAMLQAVLKDGLLTKLDAVAGSISGIVDQLLVAVTLAQAHGKRAKDSGKLRAVIVDTVQGVRADMETTVHSEVARVVALIGSMTEKSEMEESGEGEEEEEQQQQQQAS